MKDVNKYPFELRTLTAEEGGGYLVSFPDFNECIADGETIEEAISEGQQALAAVIATLEASARRLSPARSISPRINRNSLCGSAIAAIFCLTIYV